MKTILTTLLGILLVFHSTAQKFFSPAKTNVPANLNVARNMPKSYQLFQVDLAGLKLELSKAPREREKTAISQYGHTIALPLPGGETLAFRIADIPVMADWEKYPEIKTYTGQCVEHPAYTLKLDITPHGLHSTIFGTSEIYLIDPLVNGSPQHLVYRLTDSPPTKEILCRSGDKIELDKSGVHASGTQAVSVGTELRKYRLAITDNTEYTTHYGGTVSGAMAAIATHVNKVNGIYERDLAIRLTLVANNDLLIYWNTDDPYDPTLSLPDGNNEFLDKVNENINAIIRPSNYDIGHFIGTRNPTGGGMGGEAHFESVCSSNKGRGNSKMDGDNIENPSFALTTLAHEIGHQFGAAHTFNSSCSDNRNRRTAYEPGNGNSIMAYTSCEHGSIDGGRIPFFHSGSFNQIVTFTTSGGAGYACAVKTATGNAIPVVNAGANYYVPRSTPMLLTGTASDESIDLGNITTSWDEIDTGSLCPPASPVDNAPLFRFRTPSSDRFRYLPALNSILTNTSTVGEILPSYGRRFRMHMAVRDNRAGCGATRYDSASYYVVGTAGPFSITSPVSSTSGTENTNLTVNWNVAGTTASPINTANVAIDLSVDGGYNYFSLATSTPNDGSQSVLLPAGTKTNTARIKVRAIGNIYFAISPNFVINGGAVCFPPSGTSSCDLGEFGLYPVNNFSITNSAGTVTLLSNLNTGCPSSGAYSNYAGNIDLRPKLAKGSSYFLTGQTCTSSECNGAYLGYYIDLDGDGLFNSTGEFIGATTNRTTATTAIFWTVPTSLSDGFYRLRVKSGWEPVRAGEACNAIPNGGEVEDYFVFISSYCVPNFAYGCSQGDYIHNFTLGSYTNNGTGCSDQNLRGSYKFYTGPLLFANSVYPFTIVTGATSWPQNASIWIDFNNDKDFNDAGEQVWVNTAPATSFSGSISIPNSTAFVGTRRMRVRITEASSGGIWAASDACKAPDLGETEDYNVTIQLVNRGTLASGNQTICNGATPSSITFSTAPSGAAGFSYLWYYQNGLVAAPTGGTLTGWTSTGVTTQSYSLPTSLTTSRSYACLVTPSGGTAGWASGVRQVTVLPVFNPGTLTSGDETFCNSGNPANITMSVSPSGSGSFQYRWYYKETTTAVCPTGSTTTGWIATSGITSSYDPSSAGTVGNGRTFALLITPGPTPTCGTPKWASGCRKTFVNNCSFTPGVLASGNESICNGGNPANISFSTAASTGSAYLWYYQNGLISAPAATDPTTGWTSLGVTISSFDPPSGLTSSRTFACRVTNGSNNQWAAGVRQVTVLPALNYGTLASGNQTIPSGSVPNSISFSVLPSGSGAFGVIWYYTDGIATSPNGTWTSTGNTENTYTPSALTASRTYAALVIPSGTPGCGSVQFAAGVRQITVTSSPFTPGVLALGNQTICSGGDPNNIVFSAEPTAGSSYSWYYQDGIVAAPAASASTTGWISLGVTTSSFDPPSGLTSSRTFACRVTNGSNSQWASGVRQITVLTFNPGTVAVGDQSLCANGNPAPITLSTPPSGSGSFTFQWYYKNAVVACPTGNSVAGWSPVTSGGNMASYDPLSANTTGRTFVVLVTPSGTPTCGTASFANSCRKVTVIPSPCSSSRIALEDGTTADALSPELSQNVPNPFHNETSVQCFIPEGSRTSLVRVSSLDGRVQMEIPLPYTGYHEVRIPKGKLATGIYFYSLEIDGQKVAIRKMILGN